MLAKWLLGIVVMLVAVCRSCDGLAPQLQVDALNDIFTAARGLTWKNNTGWIADSNPCANGVNRWFGVGCSATDDIITLNLPENNLTGSIPQTIRHLPLRTIQLYSNNLSGNLPLFNSSLVILYLHVNQMGGEIPPNFFEALPNLKELALYGNSFSGPIPETIKLCTSLENLQLYKNQFSGKIPKDIAKLTNLTRLFLHGNELNGTIPDLRNLTKLAHLELGQNKLEGTIPDMFANMTALFAVDVSSNKLEGVLPLSLANKNITSLKASFNSLTGPIPEWIFNFTYLNTLFLHGNNFTGTISPKFGNLTNLELLAMYGNKLEGTIPASLGKLPKLRDLQLYTNQLNGTIPPEIGNAKELRVFLLHVNKLAGTIPSTLGNFTKPTQIMLSGNQLVGTIPREFGKFSSLIKLELSSNQLNGTIPVEFASFVNLTSLQLQNNKLSGNIPAFTNQLLENLLLSKNLLNGTIPNINLQSVKTLDYSSNMLSGIIPSITAPNLEILNLSNNNLTGSIPSLGHLSSLGALQLNDNMLSGDIPGLPATLKYWLLNNNNITGSIPTDISSLTKSIQVHLYNNQLTGEIPGEFAELADLTHLLVSHNKLYGSFPAIDTKKVTVDVQGNFLTGVMPTNVSIDLLTRNCFNFTTGAPENYTQNEGCHVYSCDPNVYGECAANYSCVPTGGRPETFTCDFNECTLPDPCFNCVNTYGNYNCTPTPTPTPLPTTPPTKLPSTPPTTPPSTPPTTPPSTLPTTPPSTPPTTQPSTPPTTQPTGGPTEPPTIQPTTEPTTILPSLQPTTLPTTTPTIVPLFCGDGMCNKSVDEDCITCPADCVAPCGLCGDGECSAVIGENCTTCSTDCLTCGKIDCVDNCNNNGACTNGICVCKNGFSGPACSIKNAPIFVVVNNTSPIVQIGAGGGNSASSTTTSTGGSGGGSGSASGVQFVVSAKQIREIDAQNKIVDGFTLSNTTFNITTESASNSNTWKYHVKLPNNAGVLISMTLFNQTTQIVFANQTQTLLPEQLKMTLSVKNWPFKSLKNSIEVVFDSGVKNADEVADECKSYNYEKDGHGVFRSYSVVIGSASLYGQFLADALVDNRPRPLSINSQKENDIILVVVRAPVFFEELVIDPNYSILLSDIDNNNNNNNNNNNINNKCYSAIMPEEGKKGLSQMQIIVVAVVCSVVGAAILVFLGIRYVFPKIHTMFHLKSEIEFDDTSAK